MTDQTIFKGKKIGMSEAYVAGVRRAITQIKLTSGELPVGSVLKIQGTSKGKGFAGVVKRYGFAGGSATHGQSDRHRAPGSIGQGTTPGRVRKNKKMAGRMGGDTKSVKQALVVAAVPHQIIWVTGPVPGNRRGSLVLTLTGTREINNIIIPLIPTPSGESHAN